MKKRPWILVILAINHILAPIGNLILNAHWAHMSFWHYTKIFFQPMNFERQWFHLVIPIVAGIAIYICRRWSFWVYLLCMWSLFVFSYQGYLQRSASVSLPWLITVYLFNIGLVAYFMVPAVRVVYMDPRLRWWQTKPRFRADIQASFQARTPSGLSEVVAGDVVNFSEGGLFMKAVQMPEDRSVIQIQFQYENENYDFVGEVIHHRQRESMGFGVRFISQLRAKAKARKLTQVLKRQGLAMIDRSSGAEDDFKVWLKRVLKTGKGLFPESTKKIG